MQICIRLFLYKKWRFLSGKLGAIWIGVCFQNSFIPFILLLLLLCNIVNIRNKGNIETREGTTVGPSESRW